MLVEINTTLYAIKVNGCVIASNLQSKSLAEATILNLPLAQRSIAEIVPITSDGKTVLFG